MVGSVVNRSATCTVFCFSAAWVSGPPASSALKDLNSSPYSDFRPLRPWCRAWNSGEPPMTRSLAASLRSAMEDFSVRPYFFAVVALTVTESLSSAGAGSSSVSPESSLAAMAAVVASTVFGAALESRYASSAPLYSGSTVIEPFLSRP